MNLRSGICFIGFGEAGGILGEELARIGCRVATWDIAPDVMQAKCGAARVRAATSFEDAVTDAALVVSAVTASSAAEVAAHEPHHRHLV